MATIMTNDELKLEIQVLEKELKEMTENRDWLCMENNIACDKHRIIGDGQTSYEEWWRYCDLTDEQMVKYKHWLDYESEEEESDA